MSTATKLEYLNDTKQLLKESINSLGGEITSQTTFRQYATELDSIYASLPKVSGSGTNINLTPTLKGRITSQINGDTFQQTYTGKNLLDIQYYENGSIDATTGQNVVNVQNGRGNNYIPVLPNTTYTISTNKNVGSLRLSEYTSDKTNIQRDTVNNNKKLTITTTANTYYVRWSFNYDNVSTVTQEIVKNLDLQLELGSTATPFEPYVGGIGSPSPSYPQKIQSVTGLQNITVCGKNLINSVGYNKGTNASGTITSNVNYLGINDYVKVEPNTTYAITFQDDVSGATLFLSSKDKNGDFIERVNLSNARTFTTGANTYYVFFYLYKNGTTFDTDGYVQLEYGSTATTYEPYQSQEYEINLGKNLFDKNNANILNALITNTGAINSNASTRTLYIPCNPNTTYAISKISSPRFVIGTTENIPSVGSSTIAFNDFSTDTSGTITTGNNAHYLLVYYYNSSGTATEQEILDSIQIEEGTQATPYSPYFTPIKLNKIGDYQDYITGTPNNWSIKRQIGSVTLNGQETWAKDGTKGFYTQKDDFIRLTNYTNAILSNNFIAGIDHNGLNDNEISGYSGSSYQGQNWIYIKYDSVSTANEFKTWLSTHNTIVDYVLATETTEAITNQEIINQLNEIYNLQSYNGTTNISVQGDLPMILDVSAIIGD